MKRRKIIAAVTVGAVLISGLSTFAFAETAGLRAEAADMSKGTASLTADVPADTAKGAASLRAEAADMSKGTASLTADVPADTAKGAVGLSAEAADTAKGAVGLSTEVASLRAEAADKVKGAASLRAEAAALTADVSADTTELTEVAAGLSAGVAGLRAEAADMSKGTASLTADVPADTAKGAVDITVETTALTAKAANLPKSVTASVPAFTVTLNGQVVDNAYRQYPLLVYKDITYFPMTYYDCRFLGLETSWKGSGEGLFINATGISGAYDAYKGKVKNSSRYSVTIPTFPITVNGVKVDNTKEEYPLLSFRDVTYFPMTWKWGAESFKWEYAFEARTGLRIASNAPHIIQTAALPKVETETENIEGDSMTYVACAAAGKVYWLAAEGKVMQAPLSNVNSAKQIYQIPMWSEGDGKTYAIGRSIVNVSGRAQLRYHQGGAIMGSDFKINLNEDGTLTKIQSSYWETVQIGDKLFAYYTGPAPMPGALIMQNAPESRTAAALANEMNSGPGLEYQNIGSMDYWYTGLEIAGAQFALIDDELYLAAAKAELGKDEATPKNDYYLSKVNLKNKETSQVGTHPLGKYGRALPMKNSIYYASGTKCYLLDTKTGKEELMGTMSGMANIYYLGLAGRSIYCADYQGELYRMGETQPVNKGAKVDGMKQGGENGEYLICTFKEEASSKYRIMVFGKDGKVVFKTADKASIDTVSIENDTLYYYNSRLKTICSADI